MPASSRPKDLIGKQVGGTNFQPAGNIWMRGILEEHYGVPHREITWIVDRSEDVPFTPPSGLRIEMKTPGKSLSDMLADGDRRAMISPTSRGPSLWATSGSRACFRTTSRSRWTISARPASFPIMHVTTIKQEIVDKYPWVTTNLVKAFEQAKTSPIGGSPIRAWCRSPGCAPRVEEQEEMLGRDPWAYGLTPANRKTLATIQRYTFSRAWSAQARARRAVRGHRSRRRRRR